MEDHAAQPTAPEMPAALEVRAALEAPAAPIVVPRARRRLKIAVSLAVVVAGPSLSLYGQEVVETAYAPATRAGDDLAKIKQALQQGSDKTDKLARELNMGLALRLRAGVASGCAGSVTCAAGD
jgi:hypothetical protein